MCLSSQSIRRSLGLSFWAHLGLLAEGKKRWCASCAKAHAGAEEISQYERTVKEKKKQEWEALCSDPAACLACKGQKRAHTCGLAMGRSVIQPPLQSVFCIENHE